MNIQKKEEIDLQRQEFIGNVSHELKTPIALIQGYAEGLKEGVIDDPESMNYYLEVIDKYGADALRFSVVSGTTIGNDIKYMPEKLDQASNFANKIWNAAKFIKLNLYHFHFQAFCLKYPQIRFYVF